MFGQARKSLWIETENSYSGVVNNSGQARKSLWIETYDREGCTDIERGSGS